MTKTALITGAAKRIGAQLARHLHQQGYNIICHYGQSQTAAMELVNELNEKRQYSATAIQADLNHMEQVNKLAQKSLQIYENIHVLINNASSFYPTLIGSTTETDWQDLFNSNVKAAFFLSQQLCPSLGKERGCIINMVDIHAHKPLIKHSLYCMAKSALAMMTQSLARELAPDIRVNGIAPGAILWPEQVPHTTAAEQSLLQQIPLQRMGTVNDINHAVQFLIEADYITGQILAVDGGRSLTGC